MASQQLQQIQVYTEPATETQVYQKPATKTGKSTSFTNSTKYREFMLNIFLGDVFTYSTKIWIYTEDFRIVARPEDGKGELFVRKYKLPAGNYFVRIDVNGQIKDNKVELFSDKNCGIGIETKTIQQVLDPPTLYSSALLRRQDRKLGVHYESTFEYYTDPAVEISRMNANSVSSVPINSGVFIFLRYPTGNIYHDSFHSKPYWENFTVTDSKGKDIVKFPSLCITDDNDFEWNRWRGSGYIGLTLSIAPGMYFLKYSGKNPRMIPIYVYEDWYTQFFMTVAEEPLFGTIRVFLSRSMEFDPYDRNHFYVDMCLAKLLNNDFTLEKDLLENVAYGKFESPMLGLLGAYIYMSGNETKNDDLFRTIVNNLQNRILRNSKDSPDIWALNLLSYTHFNKTISTDEKAFVKGTPMLRIAFDAIRNASVRYPWLVPEGSLNDHVAENQLFDSPYNTFTAFKENEFDTEFTEQMDHSREMASSLENELSKEISIQKISFTNPSIKKMEKELSVYPRISSAGFAILNAIHNNNKITLTEIAQTLNLPVNTVSRISKKLGL